MHIEISIASPANAGRAAPPDAQRRSIASPANAGRAAPPEAVRRSIARRAWSEISPSLAAFVLTCSAYNAETCPRSRSGTGGVRTIAWPARTPYMFVNWPNTVVAWLA
jgi:hypothetical protein